MSSPASYLRSLVPQGSRLMIQSECVACGASRLVSRHDGSLEEWEDGHRCKAGRKKASASLHPSGKDLKIVGGRRRT